jgi:hypothetical protein
MTIGDDLKFAYIWVRAQRSNLYPLSGGTISVNRSSISMSAAVANASSIDRKVIDLIPHSAIHRPLDLIASYMHGIRSEVCAIGPLHSAPMTTRT